MKSATKEIFVAALLVALACALAYAAGTKAKADLCKCGIACECGDAGAK